MLFIFFNTSVRHLWQHKTVVFLHWCLIRAVPLLIAQQPHKSYMIKLVQIIVNYCNAKLVNGTARIRHQCRKTAVLSCHRFLINSGVEKRTKFKYGLEICPPDVSK